MTAESEDAPVRAEDSARMRAWVDVDLAALRANFLTVREASRGAGVIAMVKADAYGLGALRVVGALEPLGCEAYGVATVAEGEALRAAGVIRPIVVFTPLAPSAVAAAAAARLTATISDIAGLERWAAAARVHGPLAFHVEVDTGMGRAGFDWRETGEWGAAVRAMSGAQLTWAGVYTHFHSADAPDATPAAVQWQRFQDALAQLSVSREDLLVHACNSAAALRWPEYAADAVRPGIFLYGGHPAPAVAGMPVPRPVASLRARIVHLKDAPPGSTVGYGTLYSARGWERWATIALGYGDGLRRILTGRAHALVRGVRVSLIGRTSMDMIVVDISSVPDVEVGDIATLIGRDGTEEILVDDVAAQAETIGYEILTGLSARLPRVDV
jgi:alanine racemase